MEELLTQNKWILPLIVSLVALATVWFIHPHILKIALQKNIVDNPDARKLQRTPIPVLGGVACFLGIVLGLGLFCHFYSRDSELLFILISMTVMLYIGVIDDIADISWKVRFFAQIVCILLLILNLGVSINSFHTLFGLGELPIWISWILTIVLSVGIINSINLIDGVNGLSSGYCIMASVVFGIYFYMLDYIEMYLLAAACAGALIPFFLHNVFGTKTRMFIGDGGSLVMGLVMAYFLLNVLYDATPHVVTLPQHIGLIPFVMSILSIPVFDTLRVMSMRMYRGKSPFYPDKSHLHHIFLHLGFSHAGTAFSILFMNGLVILSWFFSYLLDFSINVKFGVVFFFSILFTFGFAAFIKSLHDEGRIFEMFKKVGGYLRMEKYPLACKLNAYLDTKFIKMEEKK